jgi:signal transduction histidine kinase
MDATIVYCHLIWASARSKRLAGNGLQIILLTILLLGCPYVSTAGELVLGKEKSYSLADHLEILIDPAGRLTLEQIIHDGKNSEFRPVSGFVNRGYTNDTVWARTTLLRTSLFPEDSFLRLWPPYLDIVDVYIQQGDDPDDPAAYIKLSIGDHTPVATRPVADADLAVPLQLPESRPRTIYVKLRTSSTLNLSGTIHTEADYITYGSYNMARHGGYVAIALVISLINLILFIRLRDRLYLYFSLYIFTLAVNDFAISGLTTLFLPAVAHLISDYLVGIGAASGLFFFALFGMTLFATRLKSWTGSFFALLMLLAVLTALAIPVGLYNKLAPLMFFCSLASIFLLTWLSLKGVMKKSEGAFIYLSAFGISNIGYAMHFLRLLGLLPVAWWNMHAVQVASVLNMILITLAMTERVHSAETRALQAALESEQNAVELARGMTAELLEKQKSLEEALAAEREAIESQIRFVDIISHEYRTPLAIIRTNLDIYQMKACPDNCSYAPNVEKIKRAISRLEEILDVSLGKERLDRSKLEISTVKLPEFIGEIVHESSKLFEPRKFDYTSSDSGQLLVQADKVLLKTALFNLLDNACKYSPEDTAIRITCRREGNSAIITVTDFGAGIAVEELDYIFKKHYRGANNMKVRGTGLGLFLVRRIAELHNGQVELSSRENSTTVSIILPLSEVHQG